MKAAAEADHKQYRLGTHRVAVPEATLTRVLPHLADMGVTRVANITGLDRVGCPVYTVCRPNSKSLAVAQGKGLEPAAARVSAIMESIECFHAEHIQAPLRYGSQRELASALPLADVGRMARSEVDAFDPSTNLFWIEGRNLFDGSPLWLPFESVTLDYTLPLLPGSGCFAASSNGLASGNTLQEAICHGICEVVERDAVTLWKLLGYRGRSETRVDPDSVEDADCRSMLARFSAAGVEVAIWDVTSDTGIASFCALALGGADDWADPEFGAGTHPVPEVALLRALTEAAQARATFVAGVRDDLGADLYRADSRRRRRAYCTDLVAEAGAARAFEAIPSYRSDSIAEDLEWLLQRLRSVGTKQVAVVDLTRSEFAIPVVRVVIPGLEGAAGHEQGDFVPGPRARLAARAGL